MAAAAVAHQHTGNSLNVNVYGTLAAAIIMIGGRGKEELTRRETTVKQQAKCAARAAWQLVAYVHPSLPRDGLARACGFVSAPRLFAVRHQKASQHQGHPQHRGREWP